MGNITIALWIAIAHGLALATLVVSNRKGNRSANRYLGFLIFILTLPLWNTIVLVAGWAPVFRALDFNLWVTPYLWGPVLYFYIRTLTGGLPAESRVHLQHLAPFLVVLCLSISAAILKMMNLGGDLIRYAEDISLLGFYLHFGTYILASHFRLKSRETSARSSSITEDLAWLQWLLLLFGFLILIDMGLLVPMTLRGEYSWLYEVVILAEAIMMFCIGYWYLLYTGIDLRSRKSDAASKYEQSPVTADMSERVLAQLKTTMEELKPYLRNDLSLPDLAEITNVPIHYLSQIINEGANCNFYEYVNGFRVQHAADLLSEDARANITRVAFESGFNNRVSFNNAFKKRFDLTPSEFRDRRLGAPENPDIGPN